MNSPDQQITNNNGVSPPEAILPVNANALSGIESEQEYKEKAAAALHEAQDARAQSPVGRLVGLGETQPRGQLLRQQIKQWSAATTSPDVDTLLGFTPNPNPLAKHQEAMLTSFLRLWHTYTRNKGLRPEEHTQLGFQMWCLYAAQTKQLNEAGFEKPAAIAEYNDADELLAAASKTRHPYATIRSVGNTVIGLLPIIRERAEVDMSVRNLRHRQQRLATIRQLEKERVENNTSQARLTREETAVVVTITQNADKWLPQDIPEGIDRGRLIHSFAHMWAKSTTEADRIAMETTDKDDRNGAVRSVLRGYCEDVITLNTMGFRDPITVARYNAPHILRKAMQGRTEAEQKIIKHTLQVVDPVEKADRYRTIVQETQQKKLTPGIIAAAVLSNRDPTAKLTDYDAHFTALKGAFHAEPLTAQVIQRYLLRREPEQEITAFLRREAILEALFEDDEAFTSEVRSGIAINFDTDDVEKLQNAGIQWKARYEALKDAVALNTLKHPDDKTERQVKTLWEQKHGLAFTTELQDVGIIDDWALKETALRPINDLASRLRYARHLTLQHENTQEKRTDRLSSPRPSSQGWTANSNIESHIADQTSIGQDPAEIIISREDTQENAKNQTIYERLTATLTDAEIELIQYLVTHELREVDEDDLRQRLKTDSLDTYAKTLLERMRASATQESAAGAQASRDAFERNQAAANTRPVGSNNTQQIPAPDITYRPAATDTDELIASQQERQTSERQERLRTLLGNEHIRTLWEYKQDGKYNADVEQALKEQLQTSDLDTYYDNLVDYVNQDRRQASELVIETPETSVESPEETSPPTPEGSPNFYTPRPATTTEPPRANSGSEYNSFEANPYGISRQLLQIIESFPREEFIRMEQPLSNIAHTLNAETADFTSTHLRAALYGLSYAQQYIKEGISQLQVGREYVTAYLQQNVAATIDTTIPTTNVTSSDPQIDTDVFNTIDTLISRLEVTYNEMVSALAGIRWTGTMANPGSPLIASHQCISGSMLQSLEASRTLRSIRKELQNHFTLKIQVRARDEAIKHRAIDPS